MKKYVIALDEGTTSVRSIVFDKSADIVAVSQKEFRQIYPKAGFIEHDPLEIYANQYSTLIEVITKNGISPDEIAAIGITNQRETTVCWDKNTGKPIYNAIVWQCRRTADYCEELKKTEGLGKYIKETTGLLIDAYFSATKIKWILDNVEGAKEKAEKGDLLFGTIDTFLIWKLTGGKHHVTDYTNASRTMLFDINKLCWDEKLLNLFGIPKTMLPKVISSSEVIGEIDIMGSKIPLSGVAGDQQSALFGQGCFKAGEVKNTYGTGCFLLMNNGSSPNKNSDRLISTVAASIKGEKVQYATEGSVFVGGAVIQWLRDELGLINDAADSQYFASKVKDSGGVYVVPAFAGLGAPYWDMYATGTIVGLTRGAGRNHLIRAALESIAYQSNDLLETLRKETGKKITAVSVDGGASRNGLLMQFQSDISSVRIIRRKTSETTALGAAFLAGLAVGFWKDKKELLSLIEDADTFIPHMDDKARETLIKGWKNAVACASLSGKIKEEK